MKVIGEQVVLVARAPLESKKALLPSAEWLICIVTCKSAQGSC